MLVLIEILGSSVAYPSGYAQGKIIAFYKKYALIVFETSQKKGNSKSIMINVDYINKQILWKTEPIGYIAKFVQAQKKELIIIEGNHLVSRYIRNGNINWKINLINISTNKDDLMPLIDFKWNKKDRYLEAVWKLYNGCIKNPREAKFFNYESFMPTNDQLFLFRIARYGYDGLIPRERDWINFDLQSGEVKGKGCYRLLGFSEKVAVVTDFRVLYELNNKGIHPIKDSERTIKELGFPHSLHYFDNPESSSKDWFFIFIDHLRDKDFMMVFNSKNNKVKVLDIPRNISGDYRVVAAGNYLIKFSYYHKPDKKIRKPNGLFGIEVLDLNGNLIKRIKEKSMNGFKVIFLGQTRNNDVILQKNSHICRYSIPDLKLITKFKIPEQKIPCKVHKEIQIFEGKEKLIVGYIVGNLWTGYMKKRKGKQIVTTKFFNITKGEKLWSLQQELIYYKIKRKRPY
ncbi:MAG: hypothetical protein KAT34_18820 [Candidatus Aminicenantes bacterium]|nr:hypothetical protein [Candidatus Aminicenantes bacterium]